MKFPPNTAHLIGPVWRKKTRAKTAAREVSAAHGGVSVAIYAVPALDGERAYSLAWGDGRTIWRWEAAR